MAKTKFEDQIKEAAPVTTETYTDKVAETAIAETEQKPVTKLPTAYISELLSNMMEDFKAANAGLDLDFVYMGNWLVTNKKGNFVEKDDDSVSYGDTIDVVVGQGEKRWSLWGLQNSPEDGKLIVSCKERVDAEAQLKDWLDQNPEASERYSAKDIDLRYMAFVVPVETIRDNDDMPKVYLMSFSPTATISYGKYAMKVYQGGYKAQGIPARTGITQVVTRLKTAEMTSRSDAKISWLGIEFEAMGLFNPEDYKN